MTLRHRLALLACLALAAAALPAGAQNPLAIRAPLLAKDPAKPIQVLLEKSATAGELRILPREATGTPKDLPRTSRTVQVGSFKYDESRGPVTLVIDYAGALVDPKGDAEGSIEIGIECPEAATPCSYPITKGSLAFSTAFMTKEEMDLPSGRRTVVTGREAHSYSFPNGVRVELRLNARETKNLEPLELTARVIYGAHERGLPGQTTRSGLLWKVLAAIGALAVGGIWWLRRA